MTVVVVAAVAVVVDDDFAAAVGSKGPTGVMVRIDDVSEQRLTHMRVYYSLCF